MDGGDVTEPIAKVLKITEWIKIPNVNKNELRLHVFSKSLSEDAEEWWNHEINGTDTSWNELGDRQEYQERAMGVLRKRTEYSLIPIPAPRDISNPDELCKTEEFIVIKYSMGSSEEFVTDLDETMIWYNLKKTCVELIRAF
ncbi:hypothetical protein Tco_0597801 [Tanacetum coccineum]